MIEYDRTDIEKEEEIKQTTIMRNEITNVFRTIELAGYGLTFLIILSIFIPYGWTFNIVIGITLIIYSRKINKKIKEREANDEMANKGNTKKL